MSEDDVVAVYLRLPPLSGRCGRRVPHPRLRAGEPAPDVPISFAYVLDRGCLDEPPGDEAGHDEVVWPDDEDARLHGRAFVVLGPVDEGRNGETPGAQVTSAAVDGEAVVAEQKKKPGLVRVAEGIYKRNGSYVVPIWNPRTRKREWHGGIESLAEAKRVKREQEDRKQRHVRSGSETVESFAERWTRDFPRNKDSTNRHNAERVRAFARDFGAQLLADVDKVSARAWVMGGQVPREIEPFAQSWVGAQTLDGRVVVLPHRGNLQAVRAMFGDALRSGLVDFNPFVGMRLPSARGRKDITVVNAQELRQLERLAHDIHGPIMGPRMAALIRLAAWTGMRPGELYAMRWPWVDFVKGEVRVLAQVNAKMGRETLPKSDEPRTIVLLEPAADALRGLERQIGTDLVFVTTRGQQFSQRTLHYYWSEVRAAFAALVPEGHWLRQRMESGKGNLDFYELRHFAATWLLNRGASASDVAIQLGHRDNGAQVLETYGHPSEDDARDRIRRLGSAAADAMADAPVRRRLGGGAA
jgi:integrase